MTKDPVCGMTIDEEATAAETFLEGRTFRFCSAACKERFDSDPKKYLQPVDDRSPGD